MLHRKSGVICESGGTGRRARLRGVWASHTGSSPVSRTKKRTKRSLRSFFIQAAKRGIYHQTFWGCISHASACIFRKAPLHKNIRHRALCFSQPRRRICFYSFATPLLRAASATARATFAAARRSMAKGTIFSSPSSSSGIISAMA